jgi:hypothetical protein
MVRAAATATAAVVIVLLVAALAIPALTPASTGCATAASPVAPSGRFTQAQISALWVAHGGSAGSTSVSGVGPVPNPVIAGAVGMAESGGDAAIVNRIGAGGLMQIHPAEPGYLNPDTNMAIAVRKWKAAGGWQPWEAFTGRDGAGDDGPWRSYLQGAPPAPNCPDGGRAGLATFDGKPVAAWIAPILQWARQHGWQGTVSSGYRTDAEQTAIYDSGVRPAAKPRSEGGPGSNHEGSRFPEGAVDVADAPQLAAILDASPYRGQLVWAAGKDPVHFSHPHDGGY